METLDGKNLFESYKRASNLLKNKTWNPLDSVSTDVLPVEDVLSDALDEARAEANEAIKTERFADALSALSKLHAPIDSFFESIIADAEDVGHRARRLNMLAMFIHAVHAVADFSKIEG